MMENTEAGQDPVDFSRIQDTSEGDLEFEKELFEVFLEDCVERIELLRVALADSDLEAIHLQAHTVKGAGANVGTTQLHEFAARLERAEAADLSEEGKVIMDGLVAEFERVKVAISEYIAAMN